MLDLINHPSLNSVGFKTAEIDGEHTKSLEELAEEEEAPPAEEAGSW
jgi:hypothetical protein